MSPGCLLGWALAWLLLVAVLRLRRNVELAARACHELRGPATAMALAAAALAREPGGARRALPFEAQLERLRIGLDDLEAARSGRRAKVNAAPVQLERLLRGAAAGWEPAARAAGRRLRMRTDLGGAVVRADQGRLAQAVGNLVANAIEHGTGTVELRGRRSEDQVLLEVRDEGPVRRPRSTRRGRGLGIAAAAIEDVGGRLSIDRGSEGTVALLELPDAEVPRDRERDVSPAPGEGPATDA